MAAQPANTGQWLPNQTRPATIKSLNIIAINLKNYITICIRIPQIACIPKNNGTFQNSNISGRIVFPGKILNKEMQKLNSKTFILILKRARDSTVCKLNPYILKLLLLLLILLLLLLLTLKRARAHARTFTVKLNLNILNLLLLLLLYTILKRARAHARTLTVKCKLNQYIFCLLYTSRSPRDLSTSRMPSSA